MPYIDKNGKVWSKPGDKGPCPICNEDMGSKEYPVEMFPEELNQGRTVSGRYWHMSNEHGILEHYRMPRFEDLHGD